MNNNIAKIDHQKLININDGNLTNIHTFLCVAKNLSFSEAANKLFLTASAISHRISRLETQLGFKLFHRLARRITLTSDGERLFLVLNEAFDKINHEIQTIRHHELVGPLTLFSHPSIAKCWLIPRLADFAQRYPSISLNIYTGNEVIDFQRQSIDIALYYANGEFTGLHYEKLMDEEIVPVCSPHCAQQYQLTEQLGNLSHCPRLHDAKAWHYSANDAEWRTWYGKHGLPFVASNNNVYFDSSDLAISAAINHLGVAMGRRYLIQHWLDKDVLLCPANAQFVRSECSYYLVWPESSTPSPRLTVFKQWLQEQIGQEK